MKETTKVFLKTLFDPGESVYASPYGYTSKRNVAGDGWDFHWPSTTQDHINEESTLLVSINPLRGDVRNDENVTAFRSFLVEMDTGSLAEQKKYIEESGLPYSLCVFSGNKSLHFAVVLDHNLPTIELWRMHAEWILNTLPKADQNTKNPSRSIRFPGAHRPGKKMQALVEARGRISYNRLMAYLSRFPDKRPKEEAENNWEPIENNAAGMAKWCKLGLAQGFDISKGRNQTWFAVGYEFAKCGYDIDTTFKAIESHYTSEPDFQEREWRDSVKNGHARAIRKYWRTRE